MKPKDVVNYNENMGGVDRLDQMTAYYSSPRKTIRWYKKVLFHLLDMAVWNAFFLYKKYHPKSSFLMFRDSLVMSLVRRCVLQQNPNLKVKLTRYSYRKEFRKGNN